MSTDKLELHYRLQLSALMDGDLPPDEARFLLRRLQHDGELNACWERWQLCGDVLRGRAQAPAPAGFAERVAAAIAGETQVIAAPVARPRRALAKWGGGALAASVALVALFMGRQLLPEENADAAPAVASQAPASEPASAAAASVEATPVETPAADATASAALAVAATASVPRSANRSVRGSATRNQQVARIANRAPRGERANGTETAAPALVATAPIAHDPFRPAQSIASEPAARPWPRSVLQQYPSASGAFNASYGSERSTQQFYPFQPRLPQSPPLELPDSPRD